MPSPKHASVAVTPPRTPQDDEELLPYVISNEIGKGSFATVYRGLHQVTREQLAIKSVSRSILTTKLFENLQSEIEILKRMSHRHVTQLIDIIRAERNIYLIMEFCAGGDLSIYIKRRGKIEGLSYIPEPGHAPIYYPHPKEGGLHEIVVRAFLRQLARAMKFLRYHNLIHRDIKPQNLLLTPASEEEKAKGHPIGVPVLKLADFGFARVLPNAALAETLCGSPLYMAPEILRYERYDAKADLWSVGAVLYEMSVGRPPFRAQNHIELLKRIEQARSTVKFPDEDPAFAQSSSEAHPVPDDIKRLIRALLKRHPVERATYEDFFKSKALENSKFRRPRKGVKESVESVTSSTRSGAVNISARSNKEPWVFEPESGIPEGHLIIPPEVLDPRVNIPPSSFNFRKRFEAGNAPRAQTERPTSFPLPSPRSPRNSPLELTPGTPGRILDEADNQREGEYVLVERKIGDNVSHRYSAYQNKPRKHPPSPLGGRILELQASPPRTSSPLTSGGVYPPPAPVSTRSENTPPSPVFSPGSQATSGRAALNALTRALNVTSRKLWGDNRDSSSSSSRRSVSQELHFDSPARNEAEEDVLLCQLEDLAQKAKIILAWCDEIFDRFVSSNSKHFDPDSVRSDDTSEHQVPPISCVSLYVLLMSFAQRGINIVRSYQEYLRGLTGEIEPITLGEGFDEALLYFQDLFMTSKAKVDALRSLLPQDFGSSAPTVQSIIYQRGVSLSREAARKELLDQMASKNECEKLYEQSLWHMYAVRDELTQQGIPSQDLSYSIICTKLRLHRCRVRMGMSDKDRLRDARADLNLDDVPRSPAPWEI